MPATGDCAPARILVAVRAMAPVAGKPPNIGETMLAIPWPISSTLGLWRSLLMRSDTTADISDSIAPSMATVKAGPSRPWTRLACHCGIAKCGSPLGIPPKRVPMVSTGNLSRNAATVAPSMAMIAPGIRLETTRQSSIVATVPAASRVAVQRKCWGGVKKRLHPQPEFAGDLGQMQAEEIFDLRAGNQHCDAVGKADDHRPRNKLHRGAHAGCAQNYKYGAGHHGAHVKSVNAMDGDDPGNYDDESAGGPANLGLRSAQCGDQKAGDHRAVDARLRRESGCNGESHGQRQGHQPDRDPGDDIFQKFAEAVFAQADDRLGQPPVVQL